MLGLMSRRNCQRQGAVVWGHPRFHHPIGASTRFHDWWYECIQHIAGKCFLRHWENYLQQLLSQQLVSALESTMLSPTFLSLGTTSNFQLAEDIDLLITDTGATDEQINEPRASRMLSASLLLFFLLRLALHPYTQRRPSMWPLKFF